MDFLTKYLEKEFPHKELIADKSLERDTQDVEIFGTYSVLVLVKDCPDGVHYKVLSNK